MKTIIYILLLTTFSLTAQGKPSLSVFQDAKFAFMGDEARGYKAGTLNIVARLKMNGNQDKYGYLVVFPEFECAELQGIYRRYSANVGYTFNQLILPKLTVMPSVGYGWIDRFGLSDYSFSGSVEIAYPLFKHVNLTMLHQFTERSDLGFLWNDNQIKYSFFVGLEIKL